MGRTVVLIEPGRHLGGLTSGGLGDTDIGNKEAIGGLVARLLRARRRALRPARGVGPRDARRVREARGHRQPGPRARGPDRRPDRRRDDVGLRAVGRRADPPATARGGGRPRAPRAGDLAGVSKDGRSIAAMRMESGETFAGRIFIDATYEGDLMAKAGVSLRTSAARRTPSTARRSTACRRRNAATTSSARPVDPYVVPGDPASGLLPGVHAGGPGEEGEGDRRVQAYCFRMCLTDVPENRRAVPEARRATTRCATSCCCATSRPATSTRLAWNTTRCPTARPTRTTTAPSRPTTSA